MSERNHSPASGRQHIPISRTRIGGSRSRSGCKACRSRRIKCDETKPTCKRCLKANLRCETSPARSPTRNKLAGRFVVYVPPEPSLDNLSLDDSSRTALDYFISLLAPQLSNSYAPKLWTILIPRLTTNDHAVRHAAVAFSILHRAFSTQNGSVESGKTLALKHYGKSLLKLQEASDGQAVEGSERSLVCCTLFYAIEALQAHFSSAVNILTSGMRLYGQNRYIGLASSDEEHVRDLRRALASIGTAAMAIEETGRERCIWLAVDHCWREPDKSLTSIEAIRYELSLIMNDSLYLDFRVTFPGTDDDGTSSSMLEDQIALQRRYEAVKKRIAEYTTLEQPKGHDQGIALIVQATSIMLDIILECVFATDQHCFDRHLAQFVLLVQHCESFLQLQVGQEDDEWKESEEILPPTFTMSMGIIPCLYFACVRCRDHHLRGTALSLLKRCNRREGVWDSNVVAVAAETWIRYEESSAQQYWKETLDHTAPHNFGIPEELRIDHLLSKFSPERSAEFCFVLTTGKIITRQFLEWR